MRVCVRARACVRVCVCARADKFTHVFVISLLAQQVKL